MGWQIVGIFAIVAWVTLIALPYFWIMKRLGLLRVPLIHEIIGLDIAEMGSNAEIDSLIAQSIYRAHQQAVKSQNHRRLKQNRQIEFGTPDFLNRSEAAPLHSENENSLTKEIKSALNLRREVKSEQLNNHKDFPFDTNREIEMSSYNESLGPYPLESIEIRISESRIIKS